MTEYDPWNAAENAKEPPREYFGKIGIEVWAVTLQKGIGKLAFDPAVDKVEDRRTAISVTATPLPSSGLEFTTTRDMIAEFGDWPKITLKSINACGITPKALNGKFARYELVPTGRTYQKDGVTKEATTFSFRAVYNTEEEAEAAAEAFYGGNGNGSSNQAAAPTDDKERETAMAFLKALAMQADGDEAKLAALIASNAVVAKHFSVGSPEVQSLLTPVPFA